MTTNLRNCLLALLAVSLAACSANSGPSTTRSTSSVVAASTAAPLIIMAISPRKIAVNETAAVTWSSQNATVCTASGAWSGSVALSNSSGTTLGPITQSGTYTYNILCSGPGGSTTATQVLLVGLVPAPVIQFSLSPVQIQPGDSATLVWSTTDATTCTGSGGTGSDGWATTQPTANLAGLTVGPITTAGEYPYNLICTGPSGTSEQSSILTVATTAPPAPPMMTFSAQPSVIQPGQSTQFTWTSGNATACTATGGTGNEGWNGTQPTSSSGTVIGPLTGAGNFSYTLTCTGRGGSTSRSIDVLVSSAPAPTPAITLDITPTQITAGGSASLTWSTTNASACTAYGSWNGAQPLSGSAVSTGTLMVPGIYSYTLNCTGSGGSAAGTATATLTVNPAPAAILNFGASPTAITDGQSVVLSWSTSGATACTASGGSGTDHWGGSVALSSAGTSVGPVTPASVYTYSLTCTGPGGASSPASVNVTVTGSQAAGTVTAFKATPSTVLVGQSPVLTWSSVNATSCAASGTGPGWSGAVSPSSTGTTAAAIGAAGTYTYTLTCTGAGGTGAPVSVTVNANSMPPAAAIVAFTATPGAMQVGQTTQLAWSSSNATSCTASAGTGSDGWNGSVGTSSTGTPITINAAGNFTYALTCNGPGGTSAPASVTVNVSTTPPVPTIGTFTATPANVQTGQSISLAWSSTAATTCTPTGGTTTDGWVGGSGTVAASSSGTTVGPLTPAGSYTYTLTCSGPGGTSAPASLTVNVTNAPPPPSIDSLTATPTSIWVGQSTQLAWATSNASACTATGGTGSDGWNGSIGTSSAGTTVGPLNTAGTVVYTLTCTGTGGTSAPSSVSVNVNTMPAPASITSFTATPSTITTGQSSTLAWSSSGASSCTASGGAGGDGWTVGTVGTSSAATVVNPTAVGTVAYTLVCTGPGGQSAPSTVTVTVKAAVAGQPTVALAINGVHSAQIEPGTAPTLTWTSTNATSCTASGGTGTDGWSGAQPTSSTGVTLSAISTPGVYTYTLNCTGSGGSNSSSVTLTVISSAGANCDVGAPSTMLQTPAATASWTQLSGLCLLGCGVLNLNNVIDSSTTDFATEYTTVGLGASISLQVTDQSAKFPAGRTVGFVIADNGALLSLSLLNNVSVVTYLGTTVQETATASSLLQLQALGTLYDPDAGFLAFKTTKPFNSVALVVSSLANVGSSFKVYGACATLQ